MVTVVRSIFSLLCLIFKVNECFALKLSFFPSSSLCCNLKEIDKGKEKSILKFAFQSCFMVSVVIALNPAPHSHMQLASWWPL